MQFNILISCKYKSRDLTTRLLCNFVPINYIYLSIKKKRLKWGKTDTFFLRSSVQQKCRTRTSLLLDDMTSVLTKTLINLFITLEYLANRLRLGDQRNYCAFVLRLRLGA